MSDNSRQQPADGSNPTDSCPPCGPGGPRAPQPRPPGGTCASTPATQPPVLAEPPPCDPPDCECPVPPQSSSTCFDTLIEAQNREIREAERAKIFKDTLDALRTKVDAARLDYTVDAHAALLKDWKQQDMAIADLVNLTPPLRVTVAFSG